MQRAHDSARPDTMLVAFLLALTTCVRASSSFNITELIIPDVVPEDQTQVEIECRYDADFTLLNWFKGPIEFLRYEPGHIPSIKTFEILGVGKIEVLTCNMVACRVRLSSITEEASGLYTCDIEQQRSPYKFASRKANMVVKSKDHRRPLLEGMSAEYRQGEQIQAYCRGAKGSNFHWYINGEEIEEIRGSPVLNISSSRLLFKGIPPTVTVQCVEFKYDMLLGSTKFQATWKELRSDVDQTQEQSSGCDKSYYLTSSIFVYVTTLCLIKIAILSL